MSSWKTSQSCQPQIYHTSFNGATTMSSWKTLTKAEYRATHGSLQWSHDDVVVEDVGARRKGWFRRREPASMEPRRCRRGKRLIARPRSSRPVVLQWSHDDVVVENFQVPDFFVAVMMASMEPRRCRRGKQPLKRWSRQSSSASMEPRRCRRGKHFDPGFDLAGIGDASMEPRRCRRGKRRLARCLQACRTRLQWSHDDVVVENSENLDAITTTGSLQWSHDDVVVENNDHDAFPARAVVASMEPRRCRRGKRRRLWKRLHGRPGFNGATTMSSWKTLNPMPFPPVGFTLQWSHDDVVVENFGDAAPQCSGDGASMEPRRCRRGKRSPASAGVSSRLASMEPRRCRRGKRPVDRRLHHLGQASMEPRRCRRGKPRDGYVGLELLCLLQWSHDDVVVENNAQHGQYLRLLDASMEPRRCRRGKPTATTRRRSR